MTLEILTADGLSPLRHGFFTRKGGASSGVFAGLNCGYGSSDQREIVTINRARAGDGTVTHYGKRLAAHLMVQPVAAAKLLGDPIANGQGFLARFLITKPTSTISLLVEEWLGFRIKT